MNALTTPCNRVYASRTTTISGQPHPTDIAVFLRPKFIYGRDDRPKYKTFGEYASRLIAVVESRLPATNGQVYILNNQEAVMAAQSSHTQVTPEFRPYVEIIDGQVKTTSLKISEHFKKRHDDVLRKIQNLDCSKEFWLRNFTESTYIDERGKKQPYYEITRDGFTFLVMGFTGAKAAQWKEAYIAAFNQLELSLLNAHQSGLSLSDVEKLIDAKLNAQVKPSSPQSVNPLAYRLRAARPNEIRVIADLPIEDLNKQIMPQGYKVVRYE